MYICKINKSENFKHLISLIKFGCRKMAITCLSPHSQDLQLKIKTLIMYMCAIIYFLFWKKKKRNWYLYEFIFGYKRRVFFFFPSIRMKFKRETMGWRKKLLAEWVLDFKLKPGRKNQIGPKKYLLDPNFDKIRFWPTVLNPCGLAFRESKHNPS